MNRVGIYLRVSTEEQARIVDGSLVSQKSRTKWRRERDLNPQVLSDAAFRVR
jgi:hypothetical protein